MHPQPPGYGQVVEGHGGVASTGQDGVGAQKIPGEVMVTIPAAFPPPIIENCKLKVLAHLLVIF